ncbi:serine protease inhibitor [Abeliophyllum distichum]|uniref:Serine protease inhibitor n=1 Tax=Abeliophyllum distichum TaxID=126358 RepID=A0ABD1VYC4_9LAMI
MHLLSDKSSSIFILTVLLSTLLPPTVRSNPNFLKLPSDQQEDDLCPVIFTSNSDACPVKCFRPDPVCGVDGVTYWCGCMDAHCAGMRVKKLGFCEVGNGGSGPAGQALLLVHLVWLILLGVFVLFGLL